MTNSGKPQGINRTVGWTIPNGKIQDVYYYDPPVLAKDIPDLDAPDLMIYSKNPYDKDNTEYIIKIKPSISKL